MNLLHGHVVWQRAMAGDLKLVADAAGNDFVDIEDGGKLGCGAAQALFDLAVALKELGIFYGCGLVFNVGEHFVHLRQVAANFVLDVAHKTVSLLEGEVFIDLKMLLDAQASAYGLHADFVQRDVVARGNGPNLVEDAFRRGGTRNGVNDDVGSGDHAVHGRRGFAHQVFGFLEGEMAREGKREVGKVAAAGAPHARLIDGENAVGLLKLGEDAAAGFRRDRIRECADGAPGKLPAKVQNEHRDHDGGDGVGIAQPGNVEDVAGPGDAQADEDSGAGPDVGREVEGVGGESFALMAGGNNFEVARAPEIDAHGGAEDQERPDAVAQRFRLDEDAHDGFGGDPDTGGQHEERLNEGGK